MKKFYLIATLVILAGVYSYHFLAAEQAEEQIDEAIQEQLNKNGSTLSMQYSEIDISPFSGNIDFVDLTVINEKLIERSKKLTFDLSYWDFLKIYAGGAEYGLNQDGIFRLKAEKVSLLNRKSLQETKADELTLTYRGNLWQTISGFLTEQPLQKTREISFNALNLRYLQPESPVGSFKADSMESTIQLIQKGAAYRSQSQINFSSITWTPPTNFQRNYEFFIKGFGFQPDSIAITSAEFSIDFNTAQQAVTLGNSTISTSLADFKLSGNGTWASPISQSQIDTLTVRGTHFSEQFKNVLNNAEQLLGIQLPREGNDIVLKISGSIQSPKIVE